MIAFTSTKSCLSPYRQVAVLSDVALATADHLVGDLHDEGRHPLRAEKDQSLSTEILCENLL